MDLSEFKILCSNKQTWGLSVSHEEKKWKFTCWPYEVFSNNVDVKLKVVGRTNTKKWHLVGDGYLNFTEDTVIFSDSYSDIDESILSKLNIFITYNNKTIFPKQTLL